MYSYSELFQILMENDSVYNFFFHYYIEEVTSWRIYEELKDYKENGIDERYVLSRYMAQWIPWEEHADKLCTRIKEMAGE